MIPFGDTVRVWRAHRGLTQAQLARAAHLARPNVSAIERGRREVSLSTLRALAAALDVRPGVLVDGLPPPQAPAPAQLTRAALERIASAAATPATLHDPGEQTLATWLRALTRPGRRGRRRSLDAWLNLKAACPPALLQTLLERVREQSAA
jgi:transcriptional regulator with XRE-family HTH domain